MIQYIIFLIIILFCANPVKKEKFNFIDIFILIILTIFAGIRNGIGTDYYIYQSLYDNINISKDALRTGAGYYYFMSFFNNLHFNYHQFLLIVAFITNINIYYFIKKESDNDNAMKLSFILYILLGFYISQFNIMRQMLAFSIVLLSLHFLKNKKIFLGIVLAIMGCLIHYTMLAFALITIFSYLFLNKKLSIGIMSILTVTLLLDFGKFYNFIVSHILFINGYGNFDESFNSGIGTILMVVFYLFWVISIEFLVNKKLFEKKENIKIINIFYIGVSLLIISIKNVMFGRIASSFFFFIIFIIPKILDNIKIKENQVKYISAIDIGISIVYYFMSIYYFNGVFPYQTFL